MKRTRFEAGSFINEREDIENEDVIKTMEALDCIYRTECHDFEDTVTSSQMIDYFWI